MHEYGIKTMTEYPSDRLLSRRGESVEPLVEGGYAAIILAVAHKEFLPIDLLAHKKAGAIIYDVKGMIDPELVDGRL